MKVWVVTVTEPEYGWNSQTKYIRGVYSSYKRAREEKDKFDECGTFSADVKEFDLEG